MKDILRAALVVEWVLIFSAVAVGLGFQNNLPEPLKEWVETEGSFMSPAGEVIAIVVLVGSLVSSIGLFFLKRWAAYLFLGVTLLAAIPDSAAEVRSPIEATLDELSLVVAGVVIGISFFSGALQKKKPDQLPPPLP